MAVSVASCPFPPEPHFPKLPILPNSALKSRLFRPLPPTPHESQSRPPMHSTSISGSIMHARRESLVPLHPRFSYRISLFVSAVTTPGSLAALLPFLDWLDFLAATSTCRQCWRLFRVPELKDIVLSRFVPGFTYVLRNRNSERLKDVPLSLHDLNVFMVSQTTPLHLYPVHALNVQSSILPSLQQDEATEKYVTLAEAHSRVVLLVQSYAHSSSALPPPETRESPSSQLLFASQNSPPHHPRELSFPAPLSFKLASPSSNAQPSPKTAVDPLQRFLGHNRSASYATTNSKSSLSFSSSTSTRSRRISIFGGGSPKAQPPPPSDPKVLKAYSSTWRRTLFHSSGGATSDDEDGPLKSPHRRFASSGTLSNSNLSLSGFRSPDSGLSSSARLPSPPPYLYAPSPHDIRLASSRLRAPILRVFHPCSDLTEDGEGIQRCEDQLLNAGLWEHLSTGDIVVNFGYIPPTTDSGPASSSSSSLSSPASSNQWLVFNGSLLVPYSPPEPLPLACNPFSLPSPFYYSHITPPSSNPTFHILRFPKIDDVPQLTLGPVSTRVPSPKSPEGHMWVRKYGWTARVFVGEGVGIGNEEGSIGLGWVGEWVLQGDGTKEARKLLLDCLRGWQGAQGRGMRWEIAREKSGDGRIWFRLLDIGL